MTSSGRVNKRTSRSCRLLSGLASLSVWTYLQRSWAGCCSKRASWRWRRATRWPGGASGRCSRWAGWAEWKFFKWAEYWWDLGRDDMLFAAGLEASTVGIAPRRIPQLEQITWWLAKPIPRKPFSKSLQQKVAKLQRVLRLWNNRKNDFFSWHKGAERGWKL